MTSFKVRSAMPGKSAARPSGVETVLEGRQGKERLLIYELPEEALGAGSSLGNDKGWVNSKATGALERLFSLDLGQVVFGSLNLRYSSEQHGLLPLGNTPSQPEQKADARPQPKKRVLLEQSRPGRFRIHPAYQEREFDLPGSLSVTETLFMPHTPDVDPAVAYQVIELRNDSTFPRSIRIFAYANFRGTTAGDVTGTYDEETGALFASNQGQADWVRALGFSVKASGYMTTHDVSRAYDPVNVMPLTNDTTAQGDLFGVIQADVDLSPGETERLAVILAFSPHGMEDAKKVFKRARDFEKALKQTLDYYRSVLDVSRLEVPDSVINQGVQWSKANMIRVMGDYPVSKAFTNEPGVSSNVVLRDLAWFVYGNDWMLPHFSAAMLKAASGKRYKNGKMAEYFSALDGHIEDYGLNINDDTPLFVLAACHHYHATGDNQFFQELIPSIEGALRYLLTQRDEQGLVNCSAKGQNVWGIASWRNVIPNYSINGAVTEINALCFGALTEAAKLAHHFDKADLAQLLDSEAEKLKDAINTHLLNPDNGMYYLNIDVDGNRHTDITSDQVFPVMFKVAPDDVAFRIISRLNSPDFWTNAGLRVLSDLSPDYDPSGHVGLLGGVWPGVVFWYAFAAAKYHPEFMVRGLREGYQNYIADPRKNNTVPGQFSEWFDGESLVNRGMRLSPWEPPRYLWAAIEGLAGVHLEPIGISINPQLPPAWQWLALSRLPYRGREISFFTAREGSELRLYMTEEVDSDCNTTVCGKDVSDKVEVWSDDTSVMALQSDSTTYVCLGNSTQQTLIVPWSLKGLLDEEHRYRVRAFSSEYGGWTESGESLGRELAELALPIEQLGFHILRFDRVD
jgi:glycogen debranching enzyme